MQIYLPKIIYSSPTKLPTLEKLILYYIIHKAFENNITNNEDSNIEIDLKELYTILNNSSIEFTDVKSQIKSAIDNLTKINMSLVDNGFHIKLAPITGIYLDKFSSKLYTVINPIIIEYLDQVFTGNYINFELNKHCK
ncbi:Uncharacterised protein [uncultured Clostridium sp.]|nr:Uncharacterised protein [uncultured Clostridium sp.]